MLAPAPSISDDALRRGQRHLVRDLAWASVTGAFSGGVILVACALALGASPVQVGLLAAIPFVMQAAQLPATLLIERLRRRRLISVLALSLARLLILALALLPLLPDLPLALALLIAAQALISLLHAVAACAVNSWLHQLIAPGELGQFFARRLFWGTLVACLATLAAGALVERAPVDAPLAAYSAAFVVAGLAGLVSSWHLARAPEPQMRTAGPPGPMAQQLLAPFGDRNFRRLLIFVGAWTVAANLTGPFLTVYLIEQRGYALGTVTLLSITSQLANALTLYVWGRLSDRLSNKAVLALALPAHFVAMLALVVADAAPSAQWQLALMYLIHGVLGVATGGIALSMGNLGLKLSPQGQGTAYLAAIGLVCAVTGGMAPIAAGALAQGFEALELSAVVRWRSAGGADEVSLLSLAHWELLFAVSALMGLYVMHALTRIDESGQASERRVAQEFALEAVRALGHFSWLGGALGSLFPFERLNERRKWWRPRRDGPASS